MVIKHDFMSYLEILRSDPTILAGIFIPIFAAAFSLIGGLGGGYFVWKLNKGNERYQKLYGPLKYHLLMMKLSGTNREEVMKSIKEWGSVEMRIALMEKHIPPLTVRWIEHRDKIKELFEHHPGLVKKNDFGLMSDFMDGCLKRDITENGQNVLAVEEDRTDKLLKAVKNLQEKLL